MEAPELHKTIPARKPCLTDILCKEQNFPNKKKDFEAKARSTQPLLSQENRQLRMQVGGMPQNDQF